MKPTMLLYNIIINHPKELRTTRKNVPLKMNVSNEETSELKFHVFIYHFSNELWHCVHAEERELQGTRNMPVSVTIRIEYHSSTPSPTTGQSDAEQFEMIRGLYSPKNSHYSTFVPNWCMPTSGQYKTNLTAVTEFFLLGFQGSQLLKNILFFLFLLVFGATICGNLLIIILVSTSKILHTPMYYFISQLSISDILLSTDIVPNMLHILLVEEGSITLSGCMTQLYFFCVSEASECLLLAVMSYDRYVAICNPLRYVSIMTSEYCWILVAICWLFAFFMAFINSTATAKLDFCGPNMIDHFFCELQPLEELACSDTFIIHIIIYIQSVPLVIVPTIIIIECYINIAVTILRISSSTGRQKAFSTCSSHLIVVSIFYWTLSSVYVFSATGKSSTISKILSLLYTVFTPLANPIIYSLRNKDIKKAIEGTLLKHKLNKPRYT
ncbi:olfactory receptor 1468-like [Dendropsophus ebraccatus]|uniref:olfactory receptor 1468-like n=1 Tax=Dendropsophus ebraccatus TaxID=150705 RepID=UPI003831EC76